MRRGFATVAAAVAIMAVMTTSFLTGARFAHQDSPSDTIAGTPVPAEIRQPLSDLMQAYQRLNDDSYWRPFKDRKTLIYHAIEGMLLSASPLDQHTIFIEPRTNQTEHATLQETNYGIGAIVTRRAQGLLIQPLVDSPAEHAGLLDGDIIIAVDGKNIKLVPSDASVALIRGPYGTTVSLTIVRAGVAKPFVVRVTRGIIPSVSKHVFGTIGYVQFGGFDVNTAVEVHKALKQLMAAHITGLIIDLRGNGGGYVDTAHDIASEFLRKGSAIYWERSNLGNGTFSDTATRVSTPGVVQRTPIVVLTDGDTASASEILTEALRENGRAISIGTTSYGKGSVQEDLNLPDHSGLRITIRLWLTPHKHSVQQVGITPDIAVPRGSTAGGQDAQIARAVRYLTTGR